MYEPDLWIWKQRQQEMQREAELERLRKTLRKGCKRSAGMSRRGILWWGLKRDAGRLLKVLRFRRSK